MEDREQFESNEIVGILANDSCGGGSVRLNKDQLAYTNSLNPDKDDALLSNSDLRTDQALAPLARILWRRSEPSHKLGAGPF